MGLRFFACFWVTGVLDMGVGFIKSSGLARV